MRLLSFLSDVERAIVASPRALADGGWTSARMVNFQQGVARLTLRTSDSSGRCEDAGAIFLQAFALADGSLCLKASLAWKDSEAFPALAVYATPGVKWEREAERIALAWLQGPPAAAAGRPAPDAEFAPLAARAV